MRFSRPLKRNKGSNWRADTNPGVIVVDVESTGADDPQLRGAAKKRLPIFPNPAGPARQYELAVGTVDRRIVRPQALSLRSLDP